MTHLIDPSRYVGRRVEFVDGDRRTLVTVLAVGSGGVLIDLPDGERLIGPTELHRLHPIPSGELGAEW